MARCRRSKKIPSTISRTSTISRKLSSWITASRANHEQDQGCPRQGRRRPIIAPRRAPAASTATRAVRAVCAAADRDAWDHSLALFHDRLSPSVTTMHGDIERILIPRQEIARRVRELAQQIIADHRSNDASPDLTIVPILTGAMIFCGDLIREMPIAMKIGMMTVSSYPGRSVLSQGAQVIQQQLANVKDRHVLVLDDILDSGKTMQVVVATLGELGAASVRACVLLRKDRPIAREIAVDYVGFEIPDEFVVGYGLDYNDYYRNVPDIVTLKRSVLEARP